MKEQIAVLKELQEVVLIRDEYYQTGDGSRMGEFNAKIDELKSKLSPQVRTIFERLYKRNHVAVAGLSNNCCAACGMTVPIANVQMVMQGRNLVCCSSCGRILYAADGDSVQNRAGRVDQEGKVGLERFSNVKLVIPDLKATERTEAIAELAELLEKNGAIDSADNVIAAAMARERYFRPPPTTMWPSRTCAASRAAASRWPWAFRSRASNGMGSRCISCSWQ